MAIEAVGDAELEVELEDGRKEVIAAVVHATAATLGLAATPMGEKTAPVSCI